MNKSELEELALQLKKSPDFRVLRRLEQRQSLGIPVTSEMRCGLFLDVETTGLDPLNDEIIQLAMGRFTHSLDGKICDVSEPFDQLRQPSKPIPPEITRITSLTDAAVLERQIDRGEVSASAEKADLVIAHHAAFDRHRSVV